jgi:hypothetical protein
MKKPKSTVHEERHTIELTPEAEANLNILAGLWRCTPAEALERVVDLEQIRIINEERRRLGEP